MVYRPSAEHVVLQWSSKDVCGKTQLIQIKNGELYLKICENGDEIADTEGCFFNMKHIRPTEKDDGRYFITEIESEEETEGEFVLEKRFFMGKNTRIMKWSTNRNSSTLPLFCVMNETSATKIFTDEGERLTVMRCCSFRDSEGNFVPICNQLSKGLLYFFNVE